MTEPTDAERLFSVMLAEYHDAQDAGCDPNGAYDCMRAAGAAFLKTLQGEK